MRWATQPAWTNQESYSNQTRGSGTGACSDGWVSVMTTSFFNRAVLNNQTIGNMGLRAHDEADTTAVKRFRSRDAASAYIPYTVVDYTVPALSSMTTDGLPCVTGSSRPTVDTLTPALAATFNDAGAETLDVTIEYQKLDGTSLDAVTTPAVATDQSALLSVPQGRLESGQSYRWRTKAADGGLSTSGWYGWCEFTVHALFHGDTSVDTGFYYVPEDPPLDESNTVPPEEESANPVPDNPNADDISTTSDDVPAPPEPVSDTSDIDPDMAPPQESTPLIDAPAPMPEQQITAMSATDCLSGKAICTEQVSAADEQRFEESKPASFSASMVDSDDQRALGSAYAAGAALPKKCDTAYRRWVTDRTVACYYTYATLVPRINGNPVGHVTFRDYIWNWSYTTKPNYGHHTYFEVVESEGDVAGIYATNDRINCENCTSNMARSTPSLAFRGQTAKFDSSITTNPLRNTLLYSTATMYVDFKRPGYTSVLTELGLRSKMMRCDQALRGAANSRGCIIPDFTPTWRISLSGP